MAKYTGEQEKALLRQAQAGDPVSLEILMRRHEKLVHAVVHQQWCGGWRYADIVHEGRVGLWRAILKYDPARGSAFSTYAWPAIAHQTWAAVRREAQPSVVEAGDAEERVTADVAVHVAWAQVCHTLQEVVARLPEKERWIVARHYGLDGRGGCTQQALGQLLGCTRQAVSYHLAKALRRMRHPGWSARLRAQLGCNQRSAYREALVPRAGGPP